MKFSAKIIYSPLLMLYVMGPFFHDVVPYLHKIDLRVVVHFTLLYVVVLLTVAPLFFLIKKVEKKYINLTLGIFMRLLIGVGLYLVPYLVFWSDWSMFYVTLVITLYASCVCMMLSRKELKQAVLLKDSATGAFYRVCGGKANRLSEREVGEIKVMHPSLLNQVNMFNSSAIAGFDNHTAESFICSTSNSYSSTDQNTGIVINPSSGMPMVGGISGLDVHGNSWGTNFNEPSNTYDPNRGY